MFNEGEIEADSNLTAAQKTALKTAHEVLSEHFDAHLLGVYYLIDGRENYHDTRIGWSGGTPSALGLAVMAQNTILADEDEDDED